MEKISAGKFHFVLHHCNGHNDLHCLLVLNDATGSLGNFPHCLTPRAFVLLAGRRFALSRNAWRERVTPALRIAHARRRRCTARSRRDRQYRAVPEAPPPNRRASCRPFLGLDGQRHFSSPFRDMGESGLSLERFAQSLSVKPLTPGQAVGSDLPL